MDRVTGRELGVAFIGRMLCHWNLVRGEGFEPTDFLLVGQALYR